MPVAVTSGRAARSGWWFRRYRSLLQEPCCILWNLLDRIVDRLSDTWVAVDVAVHQVLAKLVVKASDGLIGRCDIHRGTLLSVLDDCRR